VVQWNFFLTFRPHLRRTLSILVRGVYAPPTGINMIDAPAVEPQDSCGRPMVRQKRGYPARFEVHHRNGKDQAEHNEYIPKS